MTTREPCSRRYFEFSLSFTKCLTYGLLAEVTMSPVDGLAGRDEQNVRAKRCKGKLFPLVNAKNRVDDICASILPTERPLTTIPGGAAVHGRTEGVLQPFVCFTEIHL